MPKKKPEKARTTAAAPNAPAPTPAFLADLPSSVLASSISARTSVETSAMALWTSVPTEGSSAAADATLAGDTLWATGASPSDGGAGSIGGVRWNRAVRRRPARPGIPRPSSRRPPPGHRPELGRGGEAPPRACEGWGGGGPVSVLGRCRGQLVLDDVHDGRVGQRGDVTEL